MTTPNQIHQNVLVAADALRKGRLSRRDFLLFSAVLGVSASAATALAACAPVATNAPAAASPAATAGQAAAPASTAPQGVLRVGWDIPVQLDPAQASSDAEISILNSVYDYLVDIDSKSNIQPRLATKWAVADDGLTYTFTLAENVKFHDGSALTADDVVWTFDRLRDPSLKFPTADLYSNINSVAAVDSGQVEFKLKNTNPFFLYDLSDNHAVILKADTKDFGAKFNGTGPFKVTNYSPQNRMELAANPDYFIKGQPGVGQLNLIFFSDPTASVDALRGGQLDLMMRLPTPLYQTLEQEGAFNTVQVPTNGFDLVRLRSDRKPGNDPKVIQAMKLATDRKAIFDTVTAGLGAIGRDSPIGPLFAQYYDDSVPIPARDPRQPRSY